MGRVPVCYPSMLGAQQANINPCVKESVHVRVKTSEQISSSSPQQGAAWTGTPGTPCSSLKPGIKNETPYSSVTSSGSTSPRKWALKSSWRQEARTDSCSESKSSWVERQGRGCHQRPDPSLTAPSPWSL